MSGFFIDMYIVNIYTVYMPNHMIYIAKALHEEFKEETNKSGLINDLLLRHYNKAPSSLQKHYPERREVRTAKDEPEMERVEFKPLTQWSKGNCKIHGIPLTLEGRCLQKGCKYA